MEKILEKKQKILLLWDESVQEKPESIESEGLCAVRSSKGKRRPGKKERQLWYLLTNEKKQMMMVMHGNWCMHMPEDGRWNNPSASPNLN